MAKRVIIRKALIEDIPSILELWKELMDFHKERDRIFSISSTGHKKFAEHIKSHITSGKSPVFVAEAGKELVGYCLAIVQKNPPVFETKEYGLVENIAVSGKYRRRGIGEKLLHETRNWFSAKGIRRIEAHVAITNNVSTGFWAKMGLKPYLKTFFMEI